MQQRTALIILIITLSRWVMNIMFRLPYAFLPVFARGLGVDVSLFSLAVGARSFASASAPFLAALSDTRGRKFGMLLGTFIFLFGLGMVIALPIFPAFVAALLLTSFGNAAFYPAAQAFIGDRVPYAVRSRAIGLIEFSWSLSILIGVPLMGLAMRIGGWPAPFPILLLFSSACLALILALIPSDRPVSFQASRLLESFKSVFGSRPAVFVLLGTMLLSGANEAVNLVFAVWIEGSLGLQIAALSAASVVIGFAELGGESLVALITDRLGKLRAVLLGIGLNCLAVIALPLIAVDLPTTLASLFAFYLTFEFCIVSLISLTSEVLPATRATLMAFSVTFVFFGRAIIAVAALPVFETTGIWGTAGLTVIINLLALSALGAFQRRTAHVLDVEAP